MKLHAEWKRILRRAWSVRLMALAGLLTAAETLLPLFVDVLPRGVFAALSVVVITGALVSRVVAQQGMGDDAPR